MRSRRPRLCAGVFGGTGSQTLSGDSAATHPMAAARKKGCGAAGEKISPVRGRRKKGESRRAIGASGADMVGVEVLESSTHVVIAHSDLGE